MSDLLENHVYRSENELVTLIMSSVKDIKASNLSWGPLPREVSPQLWQCPIEPNTKYVWWWLDGKPVSPVKKISVNTAAIDVTLDSTLQCLTLHQNNEEEVAHLTLSKKYFRGTFPEVAQSRIAFNVDAVSQEVSGTTLNFRNNSSLLNLSAMQCAISLEPYSPDTDADCKFRQRAPNSLDIEFPIGSVEKALKKPFFTHFQGYFDIYFFTFNRKLGSFYPLKLESRAFVVNHIPEIFFQSPKKLYILDPDSDHLSVELSNGSPRNPVFFKWNTFLKPHNDLLLKKINNQFLEIELENMQDWQSLIVSDGILLTTGNLGYRKQTPLSKTEPIHFNSNERKRPFKKKLKSSLNITSSSEKFKIFVSKNPSAHLLTDVLKPSNANTSNQSQSKTTRKLATALNEEASNQSVIIDFFVLDSES